MSQGKGIITAICAVVACWSMNVEAIIDQYAPPARADGFIVKFKSNTSSANQRYTLSSVGMEVVDRVADSAGKTVFVKSLVNTTEQAVLRVLLDNPSIEYVEPNYYWAVAAIPNDAMFAAQYGLHNTGQGSGLNDADIDAVEAWDLATGNNVIVAVIDTGVDYTHSDLSRNIWQNPVEIAGNGVDDDGNGFIDDVQGWDFANNDNDPQDDHAHGTHVAGIIGAVTDNGTGIAGISWNTRIMPLKFIDTNGIGTTANAIRAINYAVNNGARIINASWGGGPFSQALYDAISAAERAGVMFVAAAGNDSMNTDDPANLPHYPSSYALDNLIAVGSSDETDSLSVFSNYGNVSVDLLAPGTSIMSTLPNNQYQTLSGTSMAAPFVSGALAVIAGQQNGLGVMQLRSAILDNVDVIPRAAGLVVTSGRLNLFNSIQSLVMPLLISPEQASLAVGQTMSFNAQGGRPPYSWSLSNTGVGSINNNGQLLAAATGVTQVIVRDSAGVTTRTGNINVMEIAISPAAVTLLPGQSIQFTASGGLAPYQWSIDNTAIATINATTGLLNTFTTGILRVTATDFNGIAATSSPIEILQSSQVSMAPMSASIAAGQSITFQGSGGVEPYQWSSSNNSVATINPSTGLLTGLTDGQVFVTVTDALGSSVTSNTISVMSLSLQSNKSTISINESLAFQVQGGKPPFQWRVTNSSVATINAAGQVVGISPGSIRVTVMDADNQLAQSEPVYILSSAILSVQASNYLMAEGGQTLINTSGGSPPYTYQVENPGILEIDAQASMIKALAPGTSIISVFDSIGNRTDTGRIEVRRIDLTPSSWTLLPGETLQVVASGGIEPYQWQLSMPEVANIDATGNITAQAAGSFTVTVTDRDGIKKQSGLFNVQVDGAPSTHQLTIQPESALLSSRGSGLQFLAGGGLAPYQFVLSDTSIGLVDAKSGVFTPISGQRGITTLIVTDADGHTVESGQISVQ